jgi:hypothetical protein
MLDTLLTLFPIDLDTLFEQPIESTIHVPAGGGPEIYFNL